MTDDVTPMWCTQPRLYAAVQRAPMRNHFYVDWWVNPPTDEVDPLPLVHEHQLVRQHELHRALREIGLFAPDQLRLAAAQRP